jgi:hypothetical protein
MILPGFTAEASFSRLKEKSRTECPGFDQPSWAGEVMPQAIEVRVIPMQGYDCTPDGKACGCSGAADCVACARAGKCVHCICSETACGCVN